ncbi:hypothetical protein EKN06_06980 [Croceicoccus ponticola]|uniref:Uncharacterized protein n=1 Tax=Croceicoccus ponticola TaxID=2217664 RepID=A0A437GZ52_9SPHN|nr:hypothetical protein [Croceicoccus ponticola]RVQ67675.1 hypothetical protein EKN06_06980 [Croceicoccus ponticola]
MDIETEIGKLAAEAMATQIVLAGLMNAINKSGDEGRAIVASAFRHADLMTELSLATIGKYGGLSQYEKHIAKVVEKLREAVVSDAPRPDG